MRSPTRRASLLFVVFALAGVACTGGGSSGASSNGASASVATPQAIFEGRLENGSGSCPDVGELFTVGDFGNVTAEPKVASKPVKDGEAWEDGVASVSCTVTPTGGDELDVVASVALSGATGGQFRIDGKFKATGEQIGIHAIFSSRQAGNTYEQKDSQCTVRYSTAFQGVAAGRVWGELVCPNAEGVSAQTACEAHAQFRFENCGQ